MGRTTVTLQRLKNFHNHATCIELNRHYFVSGL